jgi:tetratricopeptide (TPR) repeat protein
VIAAEVAAGGFLAWHRWNRPTPPVPDLADADPATANDLRALAASYTNAAEWAKLGEAYLATGYFPQAEACLRRSCQIEPEHADYRFRHAFALERIGRIEESSTQYEAAVVRHHARAADCWYYIGRNYLRLEQLGPAAEAFGHAGNLPGARFELALLDARAGRANEADAAAAKLADEHLDAYPPLSLRYRIAVARGDRAAAEEFSDQFGRRPRPLPTPFDTEVGWIFGVADGVGRARLFRDAGREAQAGRLDLAESKLRDALDARWDPGVAYRLAETAFRLGAPQEAHRVLTEAVERGGPSLELLWGLGKAEEAMGRTERAAELWERAARLATGSRGGSLWDDLSNHYRRAGKTDQASAAAARSELAAGLEALDRGRPADAAGALQRAVKSDPQLARAWFALGEAQRGAGRRDEARAAYERCLQIDPDHGRSARALRLLDSPSK